MKQVRHLELDIYEEGFEIIGQVGDKKGARIPIGTTTNMDSRVTLMSEKVAREKGIEVGTFEKFEHSEKLIYYIYKTTVEFHHKGVSLDVPTTILSDECWSALMKGDRVFCTELSCNALAELTKYDDKHPDEIKQIINTHLSSSADN